MVFLLCFRVMFGWRILFIELGSFVFFLSLSRKISLWERFVDERINLGFEILNGGEVVYFSVGMC